LVAGIVNPDGFLAVLRVSFRWARSHAALAMTIVAVGTIAVFERPAPYLWAAAAVPLSAALVRWLLTGAARSTDTRELVAALGAGLMRRIRRHPVLTAGMGLIMLLASPVAEPSRSFWPWALMAAAVLYFGNRWIGGYLDLILESRVPVCRRVCFSCSSPMGSSPMEGRILEEPSSSRLQSTGLRSSSMPFQIARFRDR
jgi:hypothetical protein